HIMISNPKDTLTDPAKRIQEIYKLIEQGEEFESLAKQFSDDQSSAKKGGKLSTFKSGQLSSVKFEDMAFSIKNVGDITKPFKTDYGWHIAKLYEKIPIAPFEEMKGSLENRVQRDSRSRIINETFLNSLKDKYKIPELFDLSYFESILNDDYFLHKWKVPETIDGSKPLVKIGKDQKTYSDFAKYLESAQKRITEKQSIKGIIESQFRTFLDVNILKYQEDNLEFENEEYAQVLDEYRNGLLLFDLMENKIWNAVKKDSVGLQEFFENNRSNYVWPDRIDANIATSSDKNQILKVKEQFEQNIDLESIKASANSNEKQNVMFTSAVMDKSHQALPEGFEFKAGVSEPFMHNNSYHVVHVKSVIPSSQKTLDEAKGKVISDFQNEVEKKWLESLEDKYKVIINTEVLKEIKSQISN
ncbi:MAG: peptidylprolyl isomerase, partial [Bacteroidia bacterium]|nr:peptidylprolyl isomerase [Bacteroidia bacterium]